MTATAPTDRYGSDQRADGMYEIVDNENGARVGIVGDWEEAAKVVQRMNALHDANTTRLARSALKHRVHDNHKDVESSCRECALVFEENPAALATMHASVLLRSVFRLNKTRRAAILRYASVSETKTIGTLTKRQRDALALALRTPGAGIYDVLRSQCR